MDNGVPEANDGDMYRSYDALGEDPSAQPDGRPVR